MFDDTYHTIAAPAEGVYKEKGSKFLAFALPVSTETAVKDHLARLRKSFLTITTVSLRHADGVTVLGLLWRLRYHAGYSDPVAIAISGFPV